MRPALHFTFAVAAAILACTPAASQSVELEDKRLILASFGDCAARLAAGQSEKLLRTEPATPEERHAAEVLGRAESSCLTNRMFLSMQEGMMRGVIAEAMFKRHHPDWLAAAGQMPASAPVRPTKPIRTAASDEAKVRRDFMIAYSSCLARAAPAQVAKLLGTAVASPDEQEAILGLGDTLHDCMPFGVKYQLNVGNLRASLASALYLQFAGQRQTVAAK
jgi:hypothetical protein